MNKDDRVYIDHILQSISQIFKYIAGKDIDSFNEDRLTRDAVVRQLEIIGEATKQVSKDLRSKNPEIPGQKWLECGRYLSMTTSMLTLILSGRQHRKVSWS